VRGRTALSLACLVALALPLLALGAGAPPGAKLTQSLRSPYVSLGRTAALAVDLESGAILYAHNATTAIAPASNEKLPVAWAALTRLGPAFRFHTEVLGVGVRTGSTWSGDLILKGYGDPTLSTPDLEALAGVISGRGIRTVVGRIRGDESFFDAVRGGPGWKHGWVGMESPPLSALVVDRADGWPALSPPLLAARALRNALARRGVHVTGRPGLARAPVSAITLATDWSPPLRTIAVAMNRYSDNFVAEMVLKTLGASEGTTGTTAGGARVVLHAMREAGIPTDGVRIADGSGLSRLDRLTAATLVGVLQAAHADPRVARAFLDSLSAAGRNGTLRYRLPALRWQVRGKTGTTNLACTLAGLIGKQVAFAVLQNGSPVATWAARAAQDRFVTVLAAATS
jgi:D-alanyl-D-alanine carboxypeptidase/D-alanyl-D-alanine-endopeptidase (penicillin-binding protein 4)